MVLLTHSLEEKPAARIRGDTEVLGSLEKHLALATSSFNFKSHVMAPFWSGYPCWLVFYVSFTQEGHLGKGKLN